LIGVQHRSSVAEKQLPILSFWLSAAPIARGFLLLVCLAYFLRSCKGYVTAIVAAAESFCIMTIKYHPNITIHGNSGTS